MAVFTPMIWLFDFKGWRVERSYYSAAAEIIRPQISDGTVEESECEINT